MVVAAAAAWNSKRHHPLVDSAIALLKTRYA
jgi:hypothetical protein